MTTDTDKLIQVAEAAGFRVVRFNDADAYACDDEGKDITPCLLYTSPSPRDGLLSRMPSSA